MFCRKCGKSIDDESTFCRFCGTEVVAIVKETRIEREYRQNNELLDKAKELMNNNNFEEAREILLDLSGFRNADELAERCLTGAVDFRRRTTYEHAKGVLNNDGANESELLLAAEDFETLGEYEDAQELAVQCRNKAKDVVERAYTNACERLKGAKTSTEILSACEELEKLGDYKDCKRLALDGRSQLYNYKRYENAVKRLDDANSVHQLMDVIEEFRALGDFLDSEEMCNRTFEKIYDDADQAAKSDQLYKLNYAAYNFDVIKTYKDAEQRAQECRKKSDVIIAQRKEQSTREKQDLDERELQYCLEILKNPKAKLSEVEAAQDRLSMIKNHEGAEAAMEKFSERLPILRQKHKRNVTIRIAVVCSIIALIMFSIIFACAILPEIKYSNAQGLAEQGKYSEAADEFESIYQYKDSRELAAKMRAQSCIEQGNIEEAASLLNNAGLYDFEKECLVSEFNRLVSEGSTDKAIELADQHTSLEENRKALCNDIIDDFLKRGKCAEAEKFCKENISDTNELSRRYYQIADTYFARKMWKDAAESYKHADNYLDAKVQEKECYTKLADTYKSWGQYENAITYYNKAELPIRVQECYLVLGKQAEAYGNNEDALKYYKKAGNAGSSYCTKLEEEMYQYGLELCYSKDYSRAIEFLQLSENSQSNELIKCCNIITNLYNGKYSLDEAYSKLWDIRYAWNKDSDSDVLAFSKTLLGLDAFSGGNAFKFFNGPTVYCYMAVFTWDNGDVKTYCISEYGRKIGIEKVYGDCSGPNEADSLARKCLSSAVSSETYIYYDPDKGYYINDNGTRVYFHLSGSNLIVENHGSSIWAGTYYEYTFVLPYGL